MITFIREHSRCLSILGGGILGSAAGLGILSLATGTSMTALPIFQAMQAAAGGFAAGGLGGLLGGWLKSNLFPSEQELRQKYEDLQKKYWEAWSNGDTKTMTQLDNQMLEVAAQIEKFIPDADGNNNRDSFSNSSLD